VGLVEHPTNPISDKVIGAAIEVHRHLGPGLLESSYHACLCRELELRAIAYHSQVTLPLEHKGQQTAKGYIIDLLIEDFRPTHDLHAAAEDVLWPSDELQRSHSTPRHQENPALTLQFRAALRVFRVSVVNPP